MITIPELRPILQRLCDGHYTAGDVNYVVEFLHEECRRYLFGRYTTILKINSGNLEKDIRDQAYDFIGPLLGRDSHGRFHILDNYFRDFRTVSHEEFETALKKFLYRRFHNELVRKVEEGDPFSKSFNRSPYYLVRKHSLWTRAEHPTAGPVYTLFEGAGRLAEREDLVEAYAGVREQAFSKFIEAGLLVLLEQMKMMVPVRELRAYLREKMSPESLGEPLPVFVDNILEMTKKMIIMETVHESNDSILLKYVRRKKLTAPVQKAFLNSIEHYLTDLLNESSVCTNSEYLAHYLPSGAISVQEYRRNYRTQFEYAAREARSRISAKIKKILNN